VAARWTSAGVNPAPLNMARLVDGSAPGRAGGGGVERSDRLFSSIANGSSLRLVVEKQDELAMAAHGYWIAVLRRRI
jgi:hypothetical protein